MKIKLKDNRGIALVIVVMLMAIILSVTTAGLLFSGINLKTTSSLRTGTSALHVADAGIQHALASIPLGFNFTYSTDENSPSEVVDNTEFPAGSGYGYTVTGVNANGGTRAILTSTATGPNSTTRVVRAYITRGNPGFCAVCLPDGTPENTSAQFNGDAFTLTGNDTNPPDSTCGTPGQGVPGLGVSDSDLLNELTNSLSDAQLDNVTGLGGSPSIALISELPFTVEELIDAYLNADDKTTLEGGNYSSGTWGTDGSPQITHITGESQIQGDITGSGVLIVDGSLRVQGNFTFNGLVIARSSGGTVDVNSGGNAGIYGSFLIDTSTGAQLTVRGKATLAYSSCALALVEALVPDNLPKSTVLLAWQELM